MCDSHFIQLATQMEKAMPKFNLPFSVVMNRNHVEMGRPDARLIECVGIGSLRGLVITFESVSPGRRHGIWLRCDRILRLDGVLTERLSIDLWADVMGSPRLIEWETGARFIQFYNIWDDGSRCSQAWLSGMILRQRGEGVLYSCNDYERPPVYNSLTFFAEWLQ